PSATDPRATLGCAATPPRSPRARSATGTETGGARLNDRLSISMFRRIFILFALPLAVAACRGRGAVDPKAPIITISIDTLRSDHLPAYGYGKIETPNIDAFRS